MRDRRRGRGAGRTSPALAASLLPEGEDVDFYRVLFEAYPEAFVVAAAGGTIVLANPAASVLLGYSVSHAPLSLCVTVRLTAVLTDSPITSPAVNLSALMLGAGVGVGALLCCCWP